MSALFPRGSAVISDCGTYRYRLGRRVTASDRICTFIMLNPSTADADENDATIMRCMTFTRALGCGLLEVVNLFAFRATRPADMKAAADPVGPLNDVAIIAAARDADKSGGFIICAWGAHGAFRDRDRAVMFLLEPCSIEPMSLAETADGLPRHPLYLRGDCKPLPYRGRPAATSSKEETGT